MRAQSLFTAAVLLSSLASCMPHAANDLRDVDSVSDVDGETDVLAAPGDDNSSKSSPPSRQGPSNNGGGSKQPAHQQGPSQQQPARQPSHEQGPSQQRQPAKNPPAEQPKNNPPPSHQNPPAQQPHNNPPPSHQNPPAQQPHNNPPPTHQDPPHQNPPAQQPHNNPPPTHQDPPHQDPPHQDPPHENPPPRQSEAPHNNPPPRQSEQPHDNPPPRQTQQPHDNPPPRQTEQPHDNPPPRQSEAPPPHRTDSPPPRQSDNPPPHDNPPPRQSDNPPPRQSDQPPPRQSLPFSNTYQPGGPAHTATWDRHTERPPPPRSTAYVPPYNTYNPGGPYQTTYYQPAPTGWQPHHPFHRTENSYTTIYVSNTVYYAPTFIQPGYVPPQQTTVYVFPTYVAPTPTGPEGSTPTTTVPASGAVNPWADQCPVPYHFWVNNFVSNSTFTSLTVSYNGGTFLCPNTPSNEITYNGVYDMYCDDDGLVRVITDGQSWITISEWSWCLPIPRPPQDLPTLEALANYTTFGQALDCEDDGYGGQVCTQTGVDFAIEVQSFGIGGDIGFEPLDINGNWLPNCPEVPDIQPIVTDTATCTGAAPTIAGGASTTIYYTVSVT